MPVVSTHECLLHLANQSLSPVCLCVMKTKCLCDLHCSSHVIMLYSYMQVLQTVTKPLGGVILLVDICQNVDTVISEMTRLKDVLSLVNLSQVRSVLVPAGTQNAVSCV